MLGNDLRGNALTLLANFPWFEFFSRILNLCRRIVRNLTQVGIYEVLSYECQLELKDKNGRLATVQKTEKVRYLQNRISAYQDQAWGDGDVFLNYQCSPGKPVDTYRLGHKTHKLISLREFRNKGDEDEFHIQWNFRNGFLKNVGFWGTGINHRTNKASVKIIFPKERPPLQFSINESNMQKTQPLGKDSQQKLANGRTMIYWEKDTPRLYENYVIRWEW